jgi:hypothetical protein
MVEDNSPMVLALVDLYDWGPHQSLSITWTKENQLNMDVLERLVAIKGEAVRNLLSAAGIFAKYMRDTVAVELEIHPMRPTHFQTWKEVKIVDVEVRKRLESGEWPNLCYGPALALSRIGSSAVEPIIEVVLKEDWLSEAQLLWALGVIGDKRALSVLRSSLSFWKIFDLGSREVRQAAKAAIDRIRKS